MTENKKQPRLFGFSAAVAALVFFINPVISLYDIFPDFIGWLLLSGALREVSRLEDRMADAQGKVVWLAVLSALRLLLGITFYDAQSTFMLLICFSLGVLETVVFISWSSEFFGGLEYLLSRNDGEATIGRTGNLRFLTVVFFLVKTFFNVLPECASLLEEAAITDITGAPRLLALASGKNLIILLGIIIVLITGVIWIAAAIKFMRAARADKPFVTALYGRYDAGGYAEPVSVRMRTVRAGFYTIIGGCVFFFQFSLDGIDLLPDLIGLALICVGAFVLSRISDMKPLIPFALFFAAGQAAFEIYDAYYAPKELLRLSDMTDLQSLTAAVFSVLAAVTAMLFFRALSKRVTVLARTLIDVDISADFIPCTLSLAVYRSCAVVSAVIPTLGERLIFPSLIFTLIWFAFICRILFNIIGSYREVTGSGI